MLLATDIGNSNVVIGLHDGKESIQVWRYPTKVEMDAGIFYQHRLMDSLLEAGISVGSIERAVYSSVVPDLSRVFGKIYGDLMGANRVLRMGPQWYRALGMQVERPNEIGTDLMSNAVAMKYKYGMDGIIVDFGTALTLTTVQADGRIRGVVIAPGLKTSISALFANTAKLPPDVPLQLPESLLGKNTTTAIQSGVLHGYVGLVRHLIKGIQQEVGSHFQPVATGGLSHVLTPLHTEFYAVDNYLTLEGLLALSRAVP